LAIPRRNTSVSFMRGRAGSSFLSVEEEMEVRNMAEKINAEKWLISEHKHSDFYKDRYASLTILGSALISVIYIITLTFHVLLTPSIFALLTVTSVGTAWAFVKFREEKKYSEGIDAFYMETRYRYETARMGALKPLTKKELERGTRRFFVR
jgi:hypothetical protein